MHNDVALLVPRLEEPRRERLFGLGVHGRDDLDPLVGLELADRLAAQGDAQPGADRLRVDEHAAGDECGVDAAQGVDHARGLDASERPAAERDVEAIALNVERIGAMHAETHALRRYGRPRGRHLLAVRVERVDARRARGCEPGEPAVSAADLEDPGAVERDERLDATGLGLVQVGDVHA